MQPNHEILEGQLKTCQHKLRCLSSYDTELKAMTAKHSTPKEHYESDLLEAQHNIKFYEAECARLEKALGTGAPTGKPGSPGIRLPQIKKPGIGTVVSSSIGFVAGALIGAKLKSGKGKDQKGGK